ncbi:hypothetical protein L0128_00060 [candidate division KSB1 bacterium]|nr:hypothetical protein [candidate division KSB1 bacterium]
MVLSCTKRIPIVKTEYQNLESRARTVYRVETFDNRGYEFRQFTITEDLLTIHYPRELDRNAETITIPLKNIKTFYKVEIHKGKTALLLSVVVLSVTAFSLLLYAFAAGMGQLQ